MVKIKSVKMELSPQTQENFNINTKIYGIDIECSGKAGGKLGNNYFSAKYKFNIDSEILKIYNLQIYDIKQVGESAEPTCEIKQEFCEEINNFLNNIFKNIVITKSEITLDITITNYSSCETTDYLVLHIIIGSNNFNSNTSYKNTETSLFTSKSKITTSDTSKDKNLKSKISSSYNSNSKLNKSYKHNNYKSKSKSNNSKYELEETETLSITTKSDTRDTSSYFSSTLDMTNSEKKHKKKQSQKKRYMQKILKLFTWSAIISFILYIFKINNISLRPKKL